MKDTVVSIVLHFLQSLDYVYIMQYDLCLLSLSYL